MTDPSCKATDSVLLFAPQAYPMSLAHATDVSQLLALQDNSQLLALHASTHATGVSQLLALRRQAHATDVANNRCPLARAHTCNTRTQLNSRAQWFQHWNLVAREPQKIILFCYFHNQKKFKLTWSITFYGNVMCARSRNTRCPILILEHPMHWVMQNTNSWR